MKDLHKSFQSYWINAVTSSFSRRSLLPLIYSLTQCKKKDFNFNISIGITQSVIWIFLPRVDYELAMTYETISFVVAYWNYFMPGHRRFKHFPLLVNYISIVKNFKQTRYNVLISLGLTNPNP